MVVRPITPSLASPCHINDLPGQNFCCRPYQKNNLSFIISPFNNWIQRCCAGARSKLPCRRTASPSLLFGRPPAQNCESCHTNFLVKMSGMCLTRLRKSRWIHSLLRHTQIQTLSQATTGQMKSRRRTPRHAEENSLRVRAARLQAR
eukprot:COSAG02_NODE_3867_length_6121_cov_1.789937_7_plen_147_part_00